ncbi:DUF898 family protein [Luteitalea sp.]|uniref:DUF898 family protein n=1 Tax=Luteitalea sp. TaxID=2004800 RepID=UPI0025C06248|nr:DUF898 family protein [Luteitalea sp.]
MVGRHALRHGAFLLEAAPQKQDRYADQQLIVRDHLDRRIPMGKSKSFTFDGGAADYLGTAILAFLVTSLTLGIAFPFGIVLMQRWRCKHTFIDGRRLTFVGTGMSLFGYWLKWLVLMVITLGIYSFWVAPRVTQWVVENTDFET